MKKLTIILLLLLLLAGCNAKSISPEVETINFKETLTQETISLKVFNVYSTGSDKATITIHDSKDVKVEARINKQLLDYNFKIELVNDELVIKSDTDTNFKDLVAEFIIYAPINKLDIRGGFKVQYDDPKDKNLDIKLSGGGEFFINNINTENVFLKLEGAGRFVLKGMTQKLDVHLEGAGSIEMFELQAKEAVLLMDGAGNIEASVSDKLTATLNGVGNISYKGNPEVSKDVNGLGSINQK